MDKTMTFKKPRVARLNRMSRWQYALLLLMLFTFSFYSLPTFFGDQPALGLHAIKEQERSPWNASDAQRLAEQGIVPKKVITSPGKVQLVFSSQDQQQRAKLILESDLLSGRSITLEYHANAPGWIQSLGAAPIKLGLDLRGGPSC